MKKIYILTAVFALLTLSLNAQLLPEFQKLKTNPTQFTELRNGQHINVSSSTTSNQGMSMRAPLRVLNEGEYYVGPYTTDEFSNSGYGFGNQYNQDQSILLGTILNRSEFEEHLGDEIVGFRFALAGSGVLPVFGFSMLPYHDDSSSLYFDQDNMKEWGMEEWNQPTTTTTNVTFNQANDYGNTSVTKDGVTISTTSGNLAYSYSQYRFYANSTTTISTTSGTITRIEFTGVRNYPVSNWSASTGNLATNGNNGTWTGNATSINFTCTSQVRCTQIIVTVSETSTPTYQILNCGQWHEYRLNEPVVFNVASDVTKLYIGYNYYQQVSNGTNYELYPISVNPNSTGHDHMALMYADASSTSTPNYQRSWWLWDFSSIGDLAVQLIFKSNLPKTDTPTITVSDPTATSVTVTATATDPTASVTLTIGDRTKTGTGTVSITIDRGTADQNLTATATAQEDGKRVSDEATAPVYVPALPVTPTPSITYEVVGNTMVITATGQGTVTLQVDGQTASGEGTAQITLPLGSDERTVTATATALAPNHQPSAEATATITLPEFGRTPQPTITYVEHNGYVEIIATGQGTVVLEAGGQTAGGVGSASIIIVRSTEDQTVTATATAKAEGLEESHPTTEDILVGALNTTPTSQTKEGLLRLHMLIVDQMLEEIPNDNSHPDRYGYVLRYEPNGPDGEGVRESGSVDVRIQKADCEVMGAYTLTEVDNDKNIGRRNDQGVIVHDQGITMNVITADVAYNLSSTNDMLWEYILQGAENRLPGYNQDYLTRLQKTQNFTYVEMLDGAPDEGHEYPNGEHHYFDANNLVQGTYGSDYMTYAPSVSTWGVTRRYFEDDGLDNTYGAPYWTTSAGKVTMDDSELMAERQQNQWNSVNWTTDAGPASLYILDNVKAVGLLPKSNLATVKYEPYMFRIFVESQNGMLRPYKVVDAVEGSDTEGEHLEALVSDDKLTDAQKYGPISVWDSYIEYDTEGNIIGTDSENGVKITTGADNEYPSETAYTFEKKKVDRPNTSTDWVEVINDTIWNEDHTEIVEIITHTTDRNAANAMFGALNAISPETGKISTDDLKVFVRFYYAVKGELADHTVVRYSAGNRGEGSRSGNGAESGGGSAGAATSVFEIAYHGEVVGQTYYNIQGMMSDKPFDGVNIVVTRYSDGSSSVAKIIR